MRLALTTAALVGLLAAPSTAQSIRRDVTPSTAFLARSVETPPAVSTLYLSGVPSTVAGGTGPQTADALAKLGQGLAAAGYGFGDVVNVKVYLVGDPAKGGAMDFAAMNAEYKKVFGAATQPNKPSRVTVQVAALAAPGALVEIEMIAAKVK